MAGELAGLRFRARGVGLRFDTRLAHGEDTDFFWRVSRRFGVRIVYSGVPVVYETVPRHRAALRHQLMRRFHLEASRFCFDRRTGRFARAVSRCARRIVWHVPVGIVLLLAAPLLSAFSLRVFKEAVLIGAGRLVGLAGLTGWNGNPTARCAFCRRIGGINPREAYSTSARSAFGSPLLGR